MRRTTSRLGALVTATLVLALATLGALVATRRVGLVITHGVSMNPLYYQGDLVVVTARPDYRVGDVVAYRRPGHSDLVLHRIIGTTSEGFVFKGDNNPSPDPTHPSRSALVGRALFHVPAGGLWLHRLVSPPALAAITVLLLGTGQQQRRRRRRMSRHASPTTTRATLSAVPAGVRALAALLVAATATAVVVSAVAWTRPAVRTERLAAERPARTTFSYTAEVGRTPAYDGTVARSPDPVFLKQARRVSVVIDYTGPAGSMSAAAEVSASSGWHTTVPLLRPTTFSGERFRTTVSLSLDDLLARGARAAEATGVSTTPLTVSIAPQVAASGRADHRPHLDLVLTPYELTLADGASSLVSTEAAAQPATRQVVATVTLGPLEGSVAVLRKASLLVAAGLLGLAWFGWALLRPSGEQDAAVLRRRYPGLFVTVEPASITDPSHLVDVTTLSALVQLAERYDTVVLTWSRSGVETFLVRHDALTYRYRTPGAPRNDVLPQSRATAQP